MHLAIGDKVIIFNKNSWQVATSLDDARIHEQLRVTSEYGAA
jgi:hypothetical protein